jgi:hypothetical protein
MKKILLILALAFTAFAFQTEAKKIALLVGISNYEDAKLGWKNLHASNDLDLLTPILNKAGFEVQTIRNNAATHNAILNKLDQLAAKSQKGDKVLILLSGHGQQKINTFGDPEPFTQTFIPFDAARKCTKKYRGERHLTDDEINLKLKAIKTKVGPSGELMVALDACHSADGTRGETEIDDEPAVTPLDGEDMPAERGDGDIFGKGILKVAKKTKKQAPMPCDFEIAACASNGVSIECRGDDGKIYGSLSYLIFKGIKSNNGVVNFGTLYNYVKKNYSMTMRSTPYCRRGGK